jgi:hypothetical protein
MRKLLQDHLKKLGEDCPVDKKHEVIFQKYTTFEYFYCKECKEDISTLNKVPTKSKNIQEEFNYKINTLGNYKVTLFFEIYNIANNKYEITAREAEYGKILPYHTLSMYIKDLMRQASKELFTNKDAIVYFK